MKKRLYAIVFLLLLVAPVATTVLFLHMEKTAIKREIKWKMIAGLDPNELVLLKFSKKEATEKLRWEHAKEFEYNGQMYDVVTKSVEGDTVYYRCWWDHEETLLNQKLRKLVASAFEKDENRQRNQVQLQVYFQTFFCASVFDWQIMAPFILVATHQSTQCTNYFTPIPLSPPTPPPKAR